MAHSWHFLDLSCPAEAHCRLAVQAQQEDKQVKKGPKCKLQQARRYRADGDSYALLRPYWQASGAMFTAQISQGSSGEVCRDLSVSVTAGICKPCVARFVSVDPNADVGIDPVLRDNGGPPRTYAPAPGSPTLDQIPLDACHPNGITTDQRGVKRPDDNENKCDIGAYESSY